MSDSAVLDGTRSATAQPAKVNRALAGSWISGSAVGMVLYLLFLMLPIYWLINMSLKTNTEISTTMTLWPREITFEHYRKIFTDPSWYGGYINSLTYVAINTILSITLALPAAYAFSRYRFVGDKHLFFWLLSNRMAPAAVFALPFFNLYSAIGLFDTPWAVALAHCLFNVPLAVWILEGFMSGVPREIDETAAIDGYSFPALLREDFHAAHRQRHRRRGVLLLHVLVGRASAGPHADQRQRQADRRNHDANGFGRWYGLGVARSRWGADHRARRARDLVCPQLHRQRIRARAGVRIVQWTSRGWHGPGRQPCSSGSSARSC